MSEDPARAEDAAIAAIRQLSGAGRANRLGLRGQDGHHLVANALLERKGEPTVLAITRGFADALRIGTQERPELFVRRIVRQNRCTMP